MITAPDRAARARELLLSCQDRVYNICVQVLRQAQDAEDAAQEALLKIAEAVGAGQDPAHFAPWMYRVALNTALNAFKERRRRRAHELRRAAMANPAEPPPDDASDALHVALAGLDDEPRAVLLQHFFEKRTLEDIARDQNCSAVAVWKRIERAKADLKSTLQRAGLGAAVIHVEGVLGAVTPAAAPPGLVTEALVAKASAMFGAPAALAAATGGIAMTAKGFSLAAVAAISLVLFLAGIGTGSRIKASHSREEGPIVQRPPEPMPAPAAASAPAAVIPIAPPAAAPPAPKEPLLPRLEALAQLVRSKLRFTKRADKEPATYQDLDKKCREAWRELREQAYAEPAAFFAFLRAEENKDIFSSLLWLLGNSSSAPDPKLTYPQGIIDGLADIIATGTKDQRRDTATCVTAGMFGAGGASLPLLDACYARLPFEKDPDVLATLINQLHICGLKEFDAMGKIEARLDLLRDLWQANSHWSVREQSLEVLANTKSEAGEAMFLEKIEETLRGDNKLLKAYVPQILRVRLRDLPPGAEDRYLPVFTAAFQTTSDGEMFLTFASMSLSLPLPKAERLLQDAHGLAPDADSKAGIERALTLLHGGETRTDVLHQTLFKKP